MGRLIFRMPEPLSTWRRIALGTWRDCGDPSVYGVMRVDATRFLERRARLKEKHRAAGGDDAAAVPTLTALVGRAIALTFSRYPSLNGMIRFGGISLRSQVDLFFQASADDEGRELSGVRVEAAETKTIYEIMAEVKGQVKRIRADEDPNFRKVKSQFSSMPPLLMGFILRATSFLIYTLNLDLSWAGVPKDPFGSVMITNIGSFGADFAFAPLVPYSRVPLLLAVGAIKDEPAVRDGEVRAVPLYNICATLDHRFIDGVYGAKMMRAMHHYLETDEGLDELGFVVD